MSLMSVNILIERVAEICRANGVKHLTLIGSFATGTAAPTSDIDFVVYGCPDMLKLEENLESIDTLQAAYTNRLIFDDEWLKMLRARNQLAHDYDGSYAAEIFDYLCVLRVF